jgi:hypothetical protein
MSSGADMPPPAAQRAANAAAEAKAVTGPYLISRRSESNFLRLLNLLSETTVSAQPEGTIEIDALKGPNGKPLQFEPLGSGNFRQVNGQELVVFQPGEGGRLELVTPYPFFAFTRPPALASRTLLLPVSIGALVILLLTVILWPIGAILRRHYRKKLELPPGTGLYLGLIHHDDANGDAVLNFKVTQSEVSKDFVMLVPIYLDLGGGRVARLGAATLSGNNSVEGHVPLKGLKERPKRAILAYYDDVLGNIDSK